MDQNGKTFSLDSEDAAVDQQALEETSQPFVGRWNALVSNTNWEKGRIIHQWREALKESGAPPTEYSDEAWSQRVGGVTGQHVGRLRRVFVRFGATQEGYAGLYWSHFQAAIDWDDAEMWLEGALQNDWSVSQMRHQRWETLGSLEGEKPLDKDVIVSDLDEDFEPAVHDAPAKATSRSETSSPRASCEDGPETGAATAASSSDDLGSSVAVYSDDHPESTVEFVRPFADLQELPEDLAEAFEAFKLAILHHKMDHWRQIAREDVLASLEALKQLVVAPSPDHALS
jgi:hypothetical protein